MSTSTILIVAGAFLACAVEMVEALTIVLGVGVVRGWRSTLIGAGAAGGRARTPSWAEPRPGARLDPDRHAPGSSSEHCCSRSVCSGCARRSAPCSSGFKDLHDEDEAFREERARAAAAGDERRGL